LGGAGAARLRFVDVPQRGGGSRRLVLLSDRDAAAYERAVARVVPAVERRLSRGVLANRSSVVGSGIRVHPWGPARGRWHGSVLRLLGTSRPPIVVVADVRDCYRSIAPETVARGLAEAGCDQGDVGAVVGFLGSLRSRGIRGLPVGPESSAVLANAALLPVDEALRVTGAVSLRWVDDVVAFTATYREATRVLHLVRATLGVLGLSLNEAKTRILPDRDEAVAFLGSSGSRAAAGSDTAVT
jgi:reverse transcriptase-like protein